MRNLDLQAWVGLLLLWLLQVLILNEIELLAYINPYIYPLAILILPAETRPITTMLIAFGLGLAVDLFEGTGGIHAFATTSVAFLRKGLIRLVATQGGLEYERLSLGDMGIRKFGVYVFTALLIHHYLLFVLDGFSWRSFWLALPEALYTALFSLTVILIGYLLLGRLKESAF